MKTHYHFVGIGGIGMGGLALLALAKGHRVSGSDIKDSKMLQTLREKGAEVFTEHSTANVGNAQRLIYSTAITENNAEIKEALRLGIPLLRRAEFLAELMGGHIVITIAGAHGKTTTSAMTAHLLTQAGLQPTCAVGGIIHNYTTNAVMGEGKYFVAEADESDGSFLNYKPNFSLITNLDKEHMDYYGTWEKLLEVHREFVANTVSDGWLICCGDDVNLREIIVKSGKSHLFYGMKDDNDIRAENIEMKPFGSSFDCYWQGKNIGKINLEIPGKHNILNALACAGLGLKLGMEFYTIANSLNSYAGVKRRFQKKGCIDDILIIDDYGHHPTEINATLAAAAATGRRLTVVFQPHRYTRLKSLYEEFLHALKDVPHLVVMDIYAASENPIEGLSIENFVSDLKKLTLNEVIYLQRDKIIPYIIKNCYAGDMVLTLGAGDVTCVSDEIVEELTKKKFKG